MNALVLLVTIPLNLVKIVALFSDKVSWLGYIVIALFKWLVSMVLLFLGSLVVKAFSRKREFAAHELAARQVSAGGVQNQIGPGLA